jgi:glycosyltransferase involved in cell wall biosynthesis
VPPGTFKVIVVDNGSTPPLCEQVLAPLRDAGHPARLTREIRPGLTAARLHAIARTSAPWMLFIDDDNEVLW